jgi:RNA polymerase sigma-70 factor (ECF subfamily)
MDEREFDELYHASFRRLTAQVYALTGDLEEARDCVQEAFARAWSHRRRLERAGHPEAWVRTTAHRIAVSRFRRIMLGRRDPDRALTRAHATASPAPDHVAVVAALRLLPEEQRRALVLHHLADLPIADIARQEGTPVGTVKARLSRGRAALALLLEEGPTHA